MDVKHGHESVGTTALDKEVYSKCQEFVPDVFDGCIESVSYFHIRQIIMDGNIDLLGVLKMSIECSERLE